MADAEQWAPEVAETHSAWVVLLGDRAYKIKKPVAFDFLDFSTREARERALQHELELNRRFSPDVYLGVADVSGPDGEPCEHVLVMRRLPAARRLATLVQRGDQLDDEIRAVARLVAACHAAAPRSSAISAAGTPDAVRGRIEQELDELAAFRGTVLDETLVDESARCARRYLAGRTALLEARVERGLIVDGHGDLMAGDIFCLDDGPRVLDCLDFDDRLRHGDVLADVAFLAMDLERLGAPRLARLLLDDYQELSGEQHPASLADYYVAYRALIRVKVACIRARHDAVTFAPEARALLELAHRRLRSAQVRLVVIGGAPGTGKSTLSSALADRLGFGLLRSDETRKDVLGLSHVDRAEAGYRLRPYDAATTAATYRALLDHARVMLTSGVSVILDASWSDRDQRVAATDLADSAEAELVQLRCEAPIEVAARRIEERRARDADASDATTGVAEAMREAFDPWPEARVIATSGTEEQAVAAALEAFPG
jgi:aminoglycoside phosphotransferase family enzyme/predicted kinase